MSTSVTRFECYIPAYSDGTSQATAIATFISQVQALVTCIQDTTYVNIGGVATYCIRIYGFLLSSQLSTAFGYLTTLNNVLGTPVLCVTESATSQP
jgi:hypothetical protein